MPDLISELLPLSYLYYLLSLYRNNKQKDYPTLLSEYNLKSFCFFKKGREKGKYFSRSERDKRIAADVIIRLLAVT